jgi:hypothetical protein
MGSDRPLRIFAAPVRPFFGRFFDKESLSPQGEPEASVIQTLGIQAVPEAFFVLVFPAADFHRMEPGDGPLSVRVVLDDRDGFHHGFRIGCALSRSPGRPGGADSWNQCAGFKD